MSACRARTPLPSLFAFTLLACGASPHASTVPPAHPASTAFAVSTAPATPSYLPTLGLLALVSDHGDDRNYLYGSMRVRVSGRETTLADQAFSAAIISATRTDAGWVFVTADGVVAGSESFTGALRRLGQTPIFPPQGARTSRGRAVVADADGTLWSTDGATDLAPVTALVGRHVDTAAFVDALHGAVVLQDGTLLFTTDGGAQWQPATTAGVTVTSVSFDNGGLVVDTAAGRRALNPDGTLGAAVAAAQDTARPPVGDATHALETALAAYPDLMIALDAVHRNDGTSVLVDRDTLVILGSTDARTQRRVTGIPLAGCALSSWGPSIAIHCRPRNETEASRAFRWSDADLVPLESPWNADDAVFSDDAMHAARLHACRGEPDSDAALCVLRDGVQEWRTVSARTPLDALLAMRGTQVLARTSDHRVVLVDTETGDVQAPNPRNEGTALSTLRLEFTRDGGLAGRADDTEEHHFALLGRTIGELRAMPLPRGAIACGFVDQQHGAAAGRTAGQFWRTVDGARTWERVDLGIDGLTREVPLLPQLDVYGAVQCTDLGCTVGHTASIRGWGTLSPPARRVMAPVTEPPAPTPPPPVAVSAPVEPPPPAPRGHRQGAHPHAHHHHHHAHSRH